MPSLDAIRTAAVVPAFLRELSARDTRQFDAYLHDEVVFQFGTLPPVEGRAAVQRFWTRVFALHAEVTLQLISHVQDEALVVTTQRQTFAGGKGEARFRSLVLYEVREGRILFWHDQIRPRDVIQSGQDFWGLLEAAIDGRPG